MSSHALKLEQVISFVLDGRSYSLLSLTIIAAPIKPRNNPATEEVQPRKFNVNVDGMTCITINKGMIQPENNRIKPRLRRRRGEIIMLADITSKPQNDSARVQNRVEIFHHINPRWLSHSADGNDSLWAGSPN